MLMTERRRVGGSDDDSAPEADDEEARHAANGEARHAADNQAGHAAADVGRDGPSDDVGTAELGDDLSPEALRVSMRAVDDVVTGPPSEPGPRGSSPSSPGRVRAWLSRRRASRWGDAPGGDLQGDVSDEGMATAEYAIATVAAAGFAGLLLIILRSDEVRGLLLGIVRGALSM